MERQRALVGAREARGGGSDVAPVMPAAGEVPTAKRQAPSASARRALSGAQDVPGADSALAVGDGEHASRGIRARAAGRGVMDDGRGGRDPGSAGRGLGAVGGTYSGREGVLPCREIAGVIAGDIAVGVLRGLKPVRLARAPPLGMPN